MIPEGKCVSSGQQAVAGACLPGAAPSHRDAAGAVIDRMLRLGKFLWRALAGSRGARQAGNQVLRSNRFEVQLPMLYRRRKGIVWYEGRIENINIQGALLHCEETPEPGSLIEVSFRLPDPETAGRGDDVFFWARVVRTSALSEGGRGRGLGVEILRYRTAPGTAADLRRMTGEVRGPFGTRRAPRAPLEIAPWDFPPPVEEPLNLWELLYAPLIQPVRRSVGTGGWALLFGAARA